MHTGVRAGAHEDINLITLLLGAEEAGLELLDKNGEWLAIKPPEGAMVVNVGDMLQRLTNHVLPSTTHRVVNPAARTTRAFALLDALLPPPRARFPDRDAAEHDHGGATEPAIRRRSRRMIICMSGWWRSGW